MHNQYYWTPSETLKKGWGLTVVVIITLHKKRLWSWNRAAQKHLPNCWVEIFAGFSVSPLTVHTTIHFVLLKMYHPPPFESSARTRKLNFATSCTVFNQTLVLIVFTGEWPRFPCGCVAFGCLQLSGNCFSRLGYPPLPLFWSVSQSENGALGYSSFPVSTHAANTRKRTHTSVARRAVPREPAPAPTWSHKSYVHVQLFSASEIQKKRKKCFKAGSVV